MTPGLPGTLRFTVSMSERDWVGRTPPASSQGWFTAGLQGALRGRPAEITPIPGID